MPRTSIGRLRAIGLVEGVSYLVLLGVAMPLKYFAGQPGAVKVVGWAHGALFVLLGLALLQVQITTRWNLVRSVVVFVAALLPFGPFLIDRSLKTWEEEWHGNRQDDGSSPNRESPPVV